MPGLFGEEAIFFFGGGLLLYFYTYICIIIKVYCFGGKVTG